MQDNHQLSLPLLGNPQQRFSSGGNPDQRLATTPQTDQLQQQRHHNLSSAARTFGNIIISLVGSGVLGLPYTFKRTGWLTSSLAVAAIGGLSYYCMMLLVWSRKRLEKDGERHADSFSDLGFLLYGKWGRLAVDFMLVLSQGAFCVAYLIFIGENLSSVLGNSGSSETMMNPLSKDGLHENVASQSRSLPSSHDLNRSSVNLSMEEIILGGVFSAKGVYIWLAFSLEVALASIRTLTKLAPFSIFADFVNFGSMAIVMQEDIATFFNKGIATIAANQGLRTLPFAIGVAIYAYEGVALVLPLESAMKERQKFGRVLGLAMACTTTFYITFGLLGYLAYGAETLDIITLNLGLGWKAAVVKVGLCVGLFFTFAVMMFPVHQVMEQRILKGRSSMLLRTAVILVAALCAVAVPNFAAFLSLVGNSVCCGLAFVVPGIFHITANRGDISISLLVLDYVIIGFGILYGVWGTISAFEEVS